MIELGDIPSMTSMPKEWQAIETAPKDGTRVLAFAPNHPDRGPIIRVTWWRNAAEGYDYNGWGEFNAEYWPPTHWMPLPEPPKN